MRYKYFEVLYNGDKAKLQFLDVNGREYSPFIFTAGVRVSEKAVHSMSESILKSYVIEHLCRDRESFINSVLSVSEVPENRCYVDRENDEVLVFRTASAATNCRREMRKITRRLLTMPEARMGGGGGQIRGIGG